jgi:hypothetical protein
VSTDEGIQIDCSDKQPENADFSMLESLEPASNGNKRMLMKPRKQKAQST